MSYGKIAVFTYRSPHFCFPCRRPCDYHTICCMDGKTIQCLPNASQHVPIFNSFRVIRCLSQCVSPKIAIFYLIFVSPGDGRGAITLNCCMAGKRIRCLQIVSQHVSIYLQQFPSYSNRKCKKSPFSRTAAHIFVSPGDAPATMMQNVASMERQFNACQTPRSMYLSIFNSF